MTRLTALLLLIVCSNALAIEQEETVVDMTPGIDALDPLNLGPLLKQGDPKALNNIGLLWARGYQGKQSWTEALQWWREAAKKGYTLSMNNLGLAYANGDGVKRDFQEAFKWWHQSAFLGNAWAMNAVGDLYENGQGVETNFLMAMTWYKSAAEQGDALGLYNVGALYDAGKGVRQDFAEALSWYRRAAAKGEATSIHAIGKMYLEGRGVVADPVEACAWLIVADKKFPPQDANDAMTNRNDLSALRAQLSDAQREAAAERARNIDALTTPAKPDPKNLKPGEKVT
jgi:TPR repeat protein